ncbi:aldehyde dehydrogenase family protein [Nocardia sp. NPDC046763]|uniref:aldehyde dehydrogenase family protein n=1 Tax=Nocardia sp. NPDC046763 TaxID=3155256 RepID=UPI0033F4ABC9
MTQQELQYIGGERRTGSGAPLTITEPATGAVIATGVGADATDVEVAAARAAFPAWAGKTPGERSDIMHGWARPLGERAADLAAEYSADHMT